MTEPSRTAMTKADLINIVAKRLDITQVQSGIIVEAALDNITEALSKGDKVELRGFGSFRIRQRNSRKGRNPKTGDSVERPRQARPPLQARQAAPGADQPGLMSPRSPLHR